MNYYKNSKALDTIKKRRISIILQDPENNICFDCSQLNPEYISINNAIFICKNCAQMHFKLNKSVSDVINNNLNNLSMKNIQYLSYGGNKNLKEFIRNNYPDLNILSPSYFYNTYALDYYRKMIEYLVEGGVKPVKPEENKGYELVNKKKEDNIGQKSKENILENNTRNNNITNKNKSYSLIKFRNYPHPRIKPIIGINKESKITYFSNTNKDNNNKLSQTITNLNDYKISLLSIDDENYNKPQMKIGSSSSQDKEKFYPNYKNNYDIDDDNNINLSSIKGTIYEFNNYSTIQNRKTKLREKILKRNDGSNVDIKIKSNSINKRNNNNIYAEYMTQNYINNYKSRNNYEKNSHTNDNVYNISKNNNNKNTTTMFNYDRRKRNNISNIELGSYLQNKPGQNGNYIFNLKLNSTKPTLRNNIIGLNNEEIQEIKNNTNTNINNINNNIIINRNLNVFYNNNNNYNEPKEIFKKKPLGNSFTLNEKKYVINDIDNLYQKNSENIFNIQKNPKKKVMKRNINEINFIKVNKMKKFYNANKEIKNNNEVKNNKNNNNNSKILQITVKKNLNNKNNNNPKYNDINNTLDEKHESMIIQRINRLIETQKERQEKNKSLSGINNTGNSNKFKFKIINIEKINKKNQEIKKEKEHSETNDENNNKEIKIKIYERNDKSSSYKNLIEPRKTNHSLMRELNNLPSGKKKNFLEIIKTNILANKSVSHSVQKIFNLKNEDNFTNK